MSPCNNRCDDSVIYGARGCWNVRPAVRALRQGELIAYPTEAVWGLGCDPQNELAVRRLLQLKHRPMSKGLILVASDLDQFEGYLGPVTSAQRERLQATWPGPVTWLCPAGPRVAPWIRGSHDRIALRVSAHPTVQAICSAFGHPVVSTSANRSGQRPAHSALKVHSLFGPALAAVVPGSCAGADRPTRIQDLLSGAVLRE